MKMSGWTKALLLGLCGVLAITSLTYLNDWILRGTYLVGNNMPVSVYGGMIVFLLTVNLLLVKVAQQLALNGRQMAVAVGLTLAVCCIPGSGLMRTFPGSLIMPYHLEKTQSGWRESGVVQMAPEKMLVTIDFDAATTRSETPEAEADDAAPENPVTPDGDAAGTDSDVVAAESAITDSTVVAAEPSVDTAEVTVVPTVESDPPAGDANAGDAGAEKPAARELAEPGALAKILDPSLDRSENRVLLEYISGWPDGVKKTIPWSAWLPALKFWIPLILLLWLCLLGLSLVFHRQWSDYEHLPYPIVDFTNALLPENDGGLAAVFKNRLFWVGAIPVFAMYMNNYLVEVGELDWVQMTLQFEVKPLWQALDIRHYGRLGQVGIYLTVVSFAFYLSPKVSFSVGISPFIWAVFATALAGWGVQVDTGSYMTPNPKKYLIFGAYLGSAAGIIYTGRHYYWSVLKRACFVKTQQKVDQYAIVGMWVFLGGIGIGTAWITQVGLDWQLALLYLLGLVMMFAVMSRIIAETGMFFIQVYWLPCGIIIGLFGAKALGPEVILILLLLSMVLAIDPREAFMPFIVNVLKLGDKQKVNLKPMSAWIAVMLVIGMMVATYMTIHLQYKNGVPFEDGWATQWVPRMPFAEAQTYHQRLTSQGILAESQSISGFARFAAINPQESSYIWWLLGGLGLVLACTAGRLTWTWWPLHPVCFLLWTSMPAQAFGWSILLGWILKVLVMKYGGASVFQRLKPLMFGLIAGEMVGLLLPAVVSMIWWIFFPDSPLKPFRVLPG